MSDPVSKYWTMKLERVAKALAENNFKVSISPDVPTAVNDIEERLNAEPDGATISWGGSMTFIKSGLYDKLKNSSKFNILDTFDKSQTPETVLERRRQALLSDLFITSTNALTEQGHLVNLDMIGNRVGAITFGPKQVFIIAGRNKIVPDVQAAMDRIKDFVAPANSIRLQMKTPCLKTGYCHDCSSPARICNSWTITEKSFPKHRVNIFLINEDLGL